MRKLTLAALAIASLAIPVTASADDVPDGADCRANGPSVTPLGTASEPDRGSACVSADGVVIAYIGGELQAEEEGNPEAGGACGAIIVADQMVAGENEDWDNPDPDGDPTTDDGRHCD